MAKKSKAKLGKGILVIAILSVLTIAAGIASIILLSHNTSIVQVFGGNDNVYESAHLEKMTINGYAINEKIPDDVREYLVLDADYTYYYNDVAFWEKDGKASGIGFYTVTGGNETDITKAIIKYENKRLVNLEDFEETFGLGEEKDNGTIKTLTYRQGDYTLTIEIYRDSIWNVILQRSFE